MEAARASGPLFDGKADAAMAAGVEAMRRAMAEAAQKLVISVFSASIRENHGTFIRSIETVSAPASFATQTKHGSYSLPVVLTDLATDLAVTTDIATYGPWLEGVGSRNQTTRFKGYHGFRQAAQELNMTAGHQAEAMIAPYVARCT